MKRKNILKAIAIGSILAMESTIIPNIINPTQIAQADDSWAVIDYAQTQNQNLSEEDLALMHEDNWLNRLVVEHSKSDFADNSSSYNVGGSKSGHSLSQLDLNDFLSITQLGSTDSTISSIPKSVKFLSNLTSFKLSGTQTSELPREMGNLANLTYLNLDNNVIVELPNWFTNFTKLKTLSVNHNRIYKIPQPFASDKNVNVLAQYNFLTTNYGRGVQYRGYYYNYMQGDGGTSSITQFALDLIIKQKVVLNLGNLTKSFKQYLLNNRITGDKANAIYGIKLLSTDESVVDNEGNVLDSGECNIKVYIPNDVGDNAWNTQNVKVQINGNINPKLSLINSEPCKETQIKCDLSDSLGYDKVILPDGTESTDNVVYYNASENGTYEFKAYDKVGNETVKRITVSNIDKVNPTLTVVSDKQELTKDNVTLSVSADDENFDYIELPNGEKVTEKNTTYEVSSNGNYTFRAVDKAKNEIVKEINITNIDKDKPTLTIVPNTKELTKDDIILSVDVDDENFDYIELPNGEKVTEKSTTYKASVNGNYSFKAVDKVGNETIKEINITNIDKDKPTLTIVPNIEEETKDNVVLSIAADDKNFDYILLPNGNKVTEKTATYEVSENGSYTFKAYDKVGNEETKVFSISNIKKDLTQKDNVNVIFNQKDSIQLTLSTNKIDFGDVTGLTHSDSHNPEDLVANVKSSLAYDIDIKATDNFKKTDETDLSVPISKLGVKVDAGDYTKFTEVNVPINLVLNAPATYTFGNDNGQDYILKFDLDSTIGYKAGVYEAPLTITATQK